jgi:general secretion pathway protein J
MKNDLPAADPAKPAYSIRGFTLLEILLAIFIFSIVVTTIFGSFNAVFSSADAIHQGTNLYEMGKNCMARMVADLQEIYVTRSPLYAKPGFNDPPEPYRVFGDSSYTGNGSFSRMRFTSFAHLPFGENRQEGIAEIIYYVALTRDGDAVLRRADTLFPYERFKDNRLDEKGSDPILCEGVKSLKFTYLDDEGAEHEYWNSESDEFDHAAPRAVKITLEIGDPKNVLSSLFFETMVTFRTFRNKLE